MEVVKAKLISLLLVFICCSAAAQEFKWETVPMDGHRVGATIPSADNVEQALGTVKRGVYTAPNGKKYRGTVARTASALIVAQSPMAFVKEKIGYAPEDILRKRPEGKLNDMLVDMLMAACEEATGQKVDVGLLNYGGVRTEIHKGNVILDNIMSMLPFDNYIYLVRLKGSDLKNIYETMTRYGIQLVGGVKLVFTKENELVSIEIGGKALEEDKEYTLATVDFLLDGGDHFQAAKNALELVGTGVLLRDGVLAQLRKMVEEKGVIEYRTDGRIAVL